MSRSVKGVGAALATTKKALPGEIVRGVRVGDGLENIVAGLGTDRDKHSFTRYNFPRHLTRVDLENMFRSSHVAKKIVLNPVDQMFREWRDFKLEDDDNNPQIEALENAEKTFQVKTKFREAMYWARLYGGSMMIMGFKDAVRPEDMKKPFDVLKTKLGDLRWINVIDRWRCAPSGRMTTDVTSPNFGLPETYIIAESSVEIHWTRILRFNGQKLPYFSWVQNGYWDDSELQHVMDSVIDYDTATQSISSMLFEANIDVVTVEGLFNLLASKEGETKLMKRFQLSQMMKSFNRTLVLDSKEQYDKKSNQYTNLDKLLELKMADVSGASNIPKSVLFGLQEGGLASGGDDDLRNYYDFCVTERSTKVDPQMDYFDQAFVRSTLGAYPDGYKAEWNSLWQTDDSDQATIDYQNAQRDQIYLQTGVITEGLAASELKRRGTYASMSAEDVQLAEELGQEMDDFQSQQRDQQLEQGNNDVPVNKTAAKKAAAKKGGKK